MKQMFLVAALGCLLGGSALQVMAGGIRFEQSMSWKELTEKARKEHRFIFVDCFASWCGPCKMMDKDVYMKDSVGSFVNAHFLAVRLQMDTAKADDESVKAMYAEVHALRAAYKIEAFPTYLFFDSDGKLVHEAIGYIGVEGFMALCRGALDPGRQYFTLLEQYQMGKAEVKTLPYMAITALGLKDRKEAVQVAKTYIDGYLAQAPDSVLFTKENIQFIRQFTTSTRDKGFQVMYRHPSRVNAVMGDSMYAQPFVDYIIVAEDVNPAVRLAAKDSLGSPDWGHIDSVLASKYGEQYATQVLAGARARWYKYKKQWDLYGSCEVTYVQMRWPRVGHWELNGIAFDIFTWCTDRQILDSAVSWMKEVVRTESDSANLLPASLDTYAGLLYKCGDQKGAMREEQQALNLALTYKVSNFIKDFTEALDKMKKGEPTWLGSTH